MTNPFKSLGKPAPQDVGREEVEGAFSCQEEGCWNVAHAAVYFDSESLLTWKCQDNHISKIEGFHID